MTKKSAASVKAVKRTNQPPTPDPQELLDSWREIELFKLSSLKTQLKRPDTYIALRKQLWDFMEEASDVARNASVKEEVVDLVKTLTARIGCLVCDIEGFTVEELVFNEEHDIDPFAHFVQLIEQDTKWTWIDIAKENIMFETLRPYIEHYFDMRRQVTEAWKILNESDEQ